MFSPLEKCQIEFCLHEYLFTIVNIEYYTYLSRNRSHNILVFKWKINHQEYFFGGGYSRLQQSCMNFLYEGVS